MGAEIKFWIKNCNEPIALAFYKDAHIHDVFKVKSYHVLLSKIAQGW